MTKPTTIQVRVTEEEKLALRARAAREGHADVSCLIRSLAVQSELLPPASEQPQPDPRDDEPPL